MSFRQNGLVFQHAGRRGKQAMAKQTRITIETESLLILRGRSSRRAWCPQCAAEMEMIAAGVMPNLGGPELQEWLNSGGLHRSQTPEGSELICLSSLLARVRSRKST